MNDSRPSGTKLSALRSNTATHGELEIFRRVQRAGILLDRLQHESLDALDLTFVEYSALRAIEMEGPPYALSPSTMADRLERTTGGMTKIVDRLERRRLVERVRDEVDRRGLQVHLTAEGRALSREAGAAYTATRERVLGLIDRALIPAIDHHLSVMLEAFEKASSAEDD